MHLKVTTMENIPQITVAVPMYNASPHLHECIESINIMEVRKKVILPIKCISP